MDKPEITETESEYRGFLVVIQKRITDPNGSNPHTGYGFSVTSRLGRNRGAGHSYYTPEEAMSHARSRIDGVHEDVEAANA